jgi:hypothetical protein
MTTSDRTEIYYTDQGSGRPIVLSHGWPLCSDAWQVELKVFADAGYRTIAMTGAVTAARQKPTPATIWKLTRRTWPS